MNWFGFACVVVFVLLLLVPPYPDPKLRAKKWAPFRSRDVEDLARLLHEAGAYTYLSKTDTDQGSWDSIGDYARECRRSEARYLLCHVRIERPR